jgi:type IV pilus assembly protein PilV
MNRGFALLEVLITVVVVAFGLLGMFGLQGKVEVAQVEAYQRAQATLLAMDMADRMRASPFDVCSAASSTTAQRNQCMAVRLANYVTSGSLGTGDSQPSDCSGQAIGSARDQCEWSKSLKGTAEVGASSNNIGAMTGARGCIEQLQAPDPSTGVCTPGVYRVTTAWQGMTQTVAPSVSCGANQYGGESYRRAVTMRVEIGLPLCK